MFGTVEIDELTAVAAPFHTALKRGGLFKGSDAVGLAVHQQYGRKFTADKGAGAELLGGLRVRETIGQKTFWSGVKKCAEKH